MTPVDNGPEFKDMNRAMLASLVLQALDSRVAEIRQSAGAVACVRSLRNNHSGKLEARGRGIMEGLAASRNRLPLLLEDRSVHLKCGVVK